MRAIFFLVVLFVLPTLCGAQGTADAWGKARDYLNCKLSLEAIRDKAKTDTGAKSLLKRVEPLLSDVTIANPPGVAQLEKELGSASRVVKLVSEPISRLDVNAFMTRPVEAFRDTAFGIFTKNYVLDMAVRVRLSDDVKAFLASAAAAPVAVDTHKDKVPVEQPKQADNAVPGATPAPVRGGNTGWLVWAMFCLLAGVCGYFYRTIDRLKDQVRQTRNEMQSVRENYADGKPGLQRPVPDRKEVGKMIGDSQVISELNTAIGKLQARINELEGKIAGVSQKPAAAPPEMSRVSAGKQGGGSDDFFYMTGPVGNYFPISAKSPTRDNTVYSFTLKGEGQASFELHTTGVPAQEIVKVAESYIKPACDEENQPMAMVRNIVTKKQGKAKLEGDKWMIISKALIRYE